MPGGDPRLRFACWALRLFLRLYLQLLATVWRGEFAVNLFLNCDHTEFLLPRADYPKDAAARRRRSAQVTRKLRLLPNTP